MGRSVRHDDKSSARLGRAVTLARHNLFLLAARGALKTLPKKGGGGEGERLRKNGGSRVEPRELLRDAAARNLIGRARRAEKYFIGARGGGGNTAASTASANFNVVNASSRSAEISCIVASVHPGIEDNNGG